ncbi:MAG: putative hydrolase of the HAD superfamily [Colwellia polaris]|jgi:putative hydrolase of the HAD superfamily
MSVVYFDLDGTLITYSKDFHPLFEEALGFEVSKEVHDYWTEHLLSNIKDMKKEPYRDALEKVERKFDLGINPEEAAERRIETELQTTQIHSGMKQLIEKLSEKHQVGILTNGVEEVQRRKIEKFCLDELVDEIIISNPEGVRKPDTEIFKLAKDRLKGENYIYVGDTFEEDVKPAQDEGFKTIYINGEREADLEATNSETLAETLISIL